MSADSEARRAFLEKMLKAWEKDASLRFGQFLKNAHGRAGHRSADLFYISNEDLLRIVESFADRNSPPAREK